MSNPDFRGRGGQGGRGQGGRGQGGGGRGQGGGNRPGAGPSGNCVCPSCGHKEPHMAGQRCIDRTCPKCGTRMIRE
ncbi:MAG: hypothetical protein JW726_11975 [Anaerolineales bacterium]|nr:hypothetical protein [Anaerolineales bacterium]